MHFQTEIASYGLRHCRLSMFGYFTVVVEADDTALVVVCVAVISTM